MSFVVMFEQTDMITRRNGRLFFTVLSGVAEFERELIRERVVAGLDRARRNGKRLGRPRTVTLNRPGFAGGWFV